VRLPNSRRPEQHNIFGAFDEGQVPKLGQRLAIQRRLGIIIERIEAFERWEMREIGSRDRTTLGARGELVAKERVEQVEVREFSLGCALKMFIKALSCGNELQQIELSANAVEQQFGHIATWS
jgi:hypothetical protein